MVGVDVNPEMLAIAQAQQEPADAAIAWQEGDAVSLPLSDNAFDLAVCQQGLQFFADRGSALREMHRVLASHGRAVLSVWQSLERHPLYEALIEAEARSQHERRGSIHTIYDGRRGRTEHAPLGRRL